MFKKPFEQGKICTNNKPGSIKENAEILFHLLLLVITARDKVYDDEPLKGTISAFDAASSFTIACVLIFFLFFVFLNGS